MYNPFEIIEARLFRIESLLLDIKYGSSIGQKTSGLIPKEKRIVRPDSTLEDLDLSVRLYNALMMAFKDQKTTLSQISEYTAYEILNIKGIGKAGLKEIQNLCLDAGITLSTK